MTALTARHHRRKYGVVQVLRGDRVVANLPVLEASHLIRDIAQVLYSLGGWNSGSGMNGRWPHQLAEGEGR